MNRKSLFGIFGVLLVVGLAFGCIGGDDTNTTSSSNPVEGSEPVSEAEPASTSSSNSGLDNPTEVQNILDLYDNNGDGKIEFLDEYSDSPDGVEEYVLWTFDAGFTAENSEEATALFVMYDEDGDWHWNKHEIDAFFNS